MSDKIKGFVVALGNDVSDERADILINIIEQLKGVIDVKKSVTRSDDYINRIRIKSELADKLYEVLKEEEHE